MGGGDLNMKKSWHPLLLKNQERVWLEEKKALEEKKKLDQLRKEKEEERQLQELQRLQEEQTGKKRTEKLEWMYATPATGTSQNPNDLEDYLLGKKRVDKILTADENAKLGATHKNFIAVQNANSARDIAAKIRDDPLLAIKQQEQAAYQALMSNPLRLRELQERNGIKPKKDKKEKEREKEERKKLKHELRHHRHHRHHNTRSRSPRSESRSPERPYQSRAQRSPEYRQSRSPSPRLYHRSDSRRHREDLSDQRRRYNAHERPHSPDRSTRFESRRYSMASLSSRRYGRSSDRSSSPDARPYADRGKRPRSSSPRYNGNPGPELKRSRVDRSPPPSPRNTNTSAMSKERTVNVAADDRAARLAAMTSNATTMDSERQKRLAILLEKEKAEVEADERARAQSKGMSGYLSYEQKRVFGGVGGLEDRIRRGKGGMVVDAD